MAARVAIMARPMPADSTPPNVGLLIADRYRTTDVIGRGGQSMVCRAEDTKTGELVAVKILRSAAASDPQAAGRFQREQQALMALAGCNVVRVIDTCRLESGALCLVMELLEGESLEQRLGRLEAGGERPTLKDIAAIIEPIVDTLEQAHGLGIIHRDLKPANIFLLGHGGVRLLDFGFARLKTAVPLTAAGMVMGSPSYIAPEVWRGMPDLVDHRADVYSLAVILFRMLAGQLPLWSESLPEMLTLATTAPRPSLKRLRADLPDDIDLWVGQALAIEPSERFHSARALLNALYMTTGPAKSASDKSGGLKDALRSAALAVKRWAIRDPSERAKSKARRTPAPNETSLPDAKTVVRVAPPPRPKPERPPVKNDSSRTARTKPPASAGKIQARTPAPKSTRTPVEPPRSAKRKPKHKARSSGRRAATKKR